MECVPSDALEELKHSLIAHGYGELPLRYEHWEWEEGSHLIYEETMRIKNMLEDLLGDRIRFVIQNGKTACSRIVEYTREHKGRSRYAPSVHDIPDSSVPMNAMAV